jgi:hypothetical protein
MDINACREARAKTNHYPGIEEMRSQIALGHDRIHYDRRPQGSHYIRSRINQYRDYILTPSLRYLVAVPNIPCSNALDLHLSRIDGLRKGHGPPHGRRLFQFGSYNPKARAVQPQNYSAGQVSGAFDNNYLVLEHKYLP